MRINVSWVIFSGHSQLTPRQEWHDRGAQPRKAVKSMVARKEKEREMQREREKKREREREGEEKGTPESRVHPSGSHP